MASNSQIEIYSEGILVGPYRVGSTIYSGNAETVYRASRPGDPSLYIIKQLMPRPKFSPLEKPDIDLERFNARIEAEKRLLPGLKETLQQSKIIQVEGAIYHNNEYLTLFRANPDVPDWFFRRLFRQSSIRKWSVNNLAVVNDYGDPKYLELGRMYLYAHPDLNNASLKKYFTDEHAAGGHRIIDIDKLGEEIAKEYTQSWTGYRKSNLMNNELFLYPREYGPGSILIELGIVATAIGSLGLFFKEYPKVKAGFEEFKKDLIEDYKRWMWKFRDGVLKKSDRPRIAAKQIDLRLLSESELLEEIETRKILLAESRGANPPSNPRATL